MISVQDAESYFDIDEFNDLYAKTKPTIYIKMSDIFCIHKLVASEIDHLCSKQDDILREIIRDLGNVKTNENELGNVSSSEICLTLHPRLANAEGMALICILRLYCANIALQTLKLALNRCSLKQKDVFCISSEYSLVRI